MSRKLDAKKGLGDFVRLCFTPRHPMMYTAISDRRLSEAVVLEVDLAVVALPGVLFSDRNAAAADAVVSPSPEGIRFDFVLRRDQFAVDKADRRFFQAEVLVPACVPRTFLHSSRFAVPAVPGPAAVVPPQAVPAVPGPAAVVPPHPVPVAPGPVPAGLPAPSRSTSGSSLLDPSHIHVDNDIIHVDTDNIHA